MHHLGPKVPKSDPKRHPKENQKSPKWMLVNLSKHMVFTVREPHWVTSGEFG